MRSAQPLFPIPDKPTTGTHRSFHAAVTQGWSIYQGVTAELSSGSGKSVLARGSAANRPAEVTAPARSRDYSAAPEDSTSGMLPKFACMRLQLTCVIAANKRQGRFCSRPSNGHRKGRLSCPGGVAAYISRFSARMAHTRTPQRPPRSVNLVLPYQTCSAALRMVDTALRHRPSTHNPNRQSA